MHRTQRTSEFKETKPQQSSDEMLCVDLVEHIVSFLTLSETPSFFVTKALRQMAGDDLFWKLRYQQLFGLLVFESDYKAQAIAMSLFQKASSTQRQDKIDTYFLRLYDFLVTNNHLMKDWAQFFIGRLQYYGEGAPDDRNAALISLRKALDAGDYRAAEFLTDKMSRNPDLLTEFLGELGQVEKCLINAHIKGMKHVARSLSILRILQNDINGMIEWMKQSIVDDPESRVAEELLWLISTNQDFPGSLRRLVSTMIHLFKQTSSGSLAAQIAFIYSDHPNVLNNADHQLTREWLEVGCMLGNASAAWQMSNVYLGGFGIPEDKEAAQRMSTIAIQAGSGLAALDYAESLQETKAKKEEVVNAFKTAFRLDIHISSTEISSLYRKEKKWHQDPKKIVWVQTATFCGCKTSIEELRRFNISNDLYPFVLCANAIITARGLTWPSYVKPDQPAAIKMLHSVSVDVVQRYRDTLKEEGLLEPYLEKLFLQFEREFQPALSPKNRSFVAKK